MVTVAPPDFESMDLGGGEFAFLVCDEATEKYNDLYIWSDGVSGGSVDKAVADRNRDAESKFNIKIRTKKVHSPRVEVARAIQSGQVDFDVVYERGTQAAVLALSGYLSDIAELPCVDLGRSYWVPTATGNLSIAGKTYVATNYITMDSLGWTECIFYNKTMYDSLGLSESLYDVVKDNKWNIDKYLDLAAIATDDLDGNGIMTSADRFGIWGDVNECLVALSKSSGVTNTQNDSTGFSLGMYNQTVVDVYTRFEELISGSSFIGYDEIWNEYPNLTAFPTRYEAARNIAFGGGHVLFMQGYLNMTDEFGSMRDDYGILPNPLNNPEQQEYYHYIDVTAPVFAVPVDSDYHDNTGIILEYMAYKSEESVMPAFFSETVGSNKAYDERDIEIFGIIKNSTRYEWTELYGLDITSSILEKMMTSGSFTSVYNRMSKKAIDEINEVYNILSSIK